jgi:hypothetical protein
MAGPITVTNLNDDGVGSLREAIGIAADGETIEFQAGLSGTLTLTTGELEIEKSLTINGPGVGVITISGNGASRIFNIGDNDATAQVVNVSNLTLTDGNANGGHGGAVYNTETLTLDHVQITDSAADNHNGGGVYVDGGAIGSLTLTNSTISGNQSNLGGGLYATAAAVTIENSTIADNSASGVGGGLSIDSNIAFAISNSTITGNTSLGIIGGFYYYGTGGGTIIGSIFASNTGPLYNEISVANSSVQVTYSLIQDTTAGITPDGTNILGVDPNLGALHDNGGGLLTRLPNAGSPAIDAGDPGFSGPSLDERGQARVVGGRIDIGAVEFRAVQNTAPPVQQPPAPPPTVAPIITADFSNLLRYQTFAASAPLPATVTTPDGQVLANPLLEQQKAIQLLIAKVDAGAMTKQAALDIIVDMADGTSSVASLSYQFFTGHMPTKEGFDYLVSSPQNPTDLNDGYYAGMSLENRYINFAVNLGKLGEGRAGFEAGYGALSLTDAATKAYTEIFGVAPAAGKIAEILGGQVNFAGHGGTRADYFLSLGGDALGAKAAVVGFFLGEAAKADLGSYAASNENFLYDLADGTAAYGANLHIYDNAGPHYW